MKSPTTTATLPRIAATILCLACFSMLFAVAASAEEPKIHYTKESYAEYEHQLASGQIQAVTINKYVRSVRVTLKDGRHVLATYGPKEEPSVAARLQAKRVPVTVLTPTVARAQAKEAPVKHKLRYIVGGIVVVVAIVVGAVLLIDRRRKAAME
jgi:ATP-dependent Zn protease